MMMQGSFLNRKPDWRVVWTKRLNNPIYNGTLTIISVIYSICLYKLDVDEISLLIINRYDMWIEMPSFILNAVFLTDLVANFIVQGIKQIYQKRKILLLELCL